MGDLKLTSASGSVTLSPENVAGTTTITLPSSTATLATNENFTSTGIDDNATSTAITIDSSERVTIGDLTLTPDTSADNLSIEGVGAGMSILTHDGGQGKIVFGEQADTSKAMIGFYSGGTDRLVFSGADSSTEHLAITNDGRGLSQFTAKAWVNITDSTQTIANSHNISSVSDDGTGKGTINFANTMVNSNYAVATHTEDGGGFNDDPIINRDTSQSRSTTAFGYYTFMNSALNDANKTSFIFYGD